MLFNKKLNIILLLIVIILVILIYRINSNKINNNVLFNEPFESSFDKGEGKIAFLFLTYDNLKRPDIWNKFFGIHNGNGNSSNKYSIYNHAKEPNKVTDILLKGKHIPENIETCWGCPNLVEANILMMKESLKDPLNKKFILVSDSCIPIVSFNKFYDEIMKDDKNRINIHYNNNFDRYDKIINPTFKKDEFTKHSGSGLVINLTGAKVLVSELENYRKNWNNVNVPDEHYIGNILRVLDPNFNNTLSLDKTTFDIWDKDKLKTKEEIIVNPEYYALFKSISNKAIDELRENNYLIIRKINEITEIDVEYILN